MNRVIEGTELAGYVHNVLGTELDERGYVIPNRFTKKQIERYALDSTKDGVDYTLRCRATSNVTIEFITDSDFAALEFEWQDAVGIPYMCADCLVDDKLTYHFYDEKLSHKFFAFELPKGEHEVQIFLSWNSIVVLRDMIIQEGASIRPSSEKKLRILTFGDSITQGYVCKHPAMCYVGRMTEKLHAEVLNQAIGGYYFEGASLDDEIASWKPDLITLAYGTNDFSCRKTIEDFEAGMRGFMEKLTEIFPKTPVLGLMPIYRNDTGFASRKLFRDYSHESAMEKIREIYKEYKNVTVLEDTYFPMDQDFFYKDFLHPADLGFLLYADAVIETIQKTEL